MSKKQIIKLPKVISKPLKEIKKSLSPTKNKKIGLALGSGGAKGFAHIGVLKVLEKEGIKIDMISGSSIGAVIAAVYATHMNAIAVEKSLDGFELRKYFDVGLPRSGIIKGDKLEDYLRKKLNNLEFKDIAIPLYITATDLITDKEIIFNSGDITKAVRASISIPGLFYPVENKKRILVDGGIKNPLPVEVLKKNGCDIVIAVNLSSMEKPDVIYESATSTKSNKTRLPNILDISTKSDEIINRELAYYRKSVKKADILIEPEVFSKDFFNFKKQKELIKAGEDAAKKHIRKIRKVVRKQSILD